MTVTEKTISSAHVTVLRDALIAIKRKTAGQRAMIRDCDAALDGHTAGLDILAREYNRRFPLHPTTLELDLGLVGAIEHYLSTEWKTGNGELGALNAVAYIGERVVAIYQARKSQRPVSRRHHQTCKDPECAGCA
jgi:hypothetical protein